MSEFKIGDEVLVAARVFGVVNGEVMVTTHPFPKVVAPASRMTDLEAEVGRLKTELAEAKAARFDAPYCYVDKRGNVRVPEMIRDELGLRDGGPVTFIPRKDGHVEMLTDSQVDAILGPENVPEAEPAMAAVSARADRDAAYVSMAPGFTDFVKLVLPPEVAAAVAPDEEVADHGQPAGPDDALNPSSLRAGGDALFPQEQRIQIIRNGVRMMVTQAELRTIVEEEVGKEALESLAGRLPEIAAKPRISIADLEALAAEVEVAVKAAHALSGPTDRRAAAAYLAACEKADAAVRALDLALGATGDEPEPEGLGEGALGAVLLHGQLPFPSAVELRRVVGTRLSLLFPNVRRARKALEDLAEAIKSLT